MRVASADKSPRRRKRRQYGAAWSPRRCSAKAEKRSSRCWRARRTTRRQVRLSLQLRSPAPVILAAAGPNAAAEVAARRLLELQGKQFAAAPNDSKVAGILRSRCIAWRALEQKGEFEDGLSFARTTTGARGEARQRRSR